jgi:hypothetical protein
MCCVYVIILSLVVGVNTYWYQSLLTRRTSLRQGLVLLPGNWGVGMIVSARVYSTGPGSLGRFAQAPPVSWGWRALVRHADRFRKNPPRDCGRDCCCSAPTDSLHMRFSIGGLLNTLFAGLFSREVVCNIAWGRLGEECIRKRLMTDVYPLWARRRGDGLRPDADDVHEFHVGGYGFTPLGASWIGTEEAIAYDWTGRSIYA